MALLNRLALPGAVPEPASLARRTEIPRRVLVLSPDPQTGAELSAALRSNPFLTEPRVWDEYPSPAELRAFLDAAPEPVLAVLVDLRREAAFELIRTVRDAPCSTVAVGLGTSDLAAARILEAMRAGASDFLAAPFQRQELAECLSRWRDHCGESGSNGSLLCFVPGREGDGASTVALQVGQALSRGQQQKALLMDFDFHASTLAFRLRLQPTFTIAEALRRMEAIEDLWGQLVCSSASLDVLLPPPSVRDIPIEHLDEIPGLLSSATARYPYVIADLPSAALSSSSGLLAMAHRIFLVCTPEISSVDLIAHRRRTLLDAGLPENRLELVLNRAGTEKGLAIADVEKSVGAPVRWALPNNYAAIAETALKASELSPQSALGTAFQQLAGHILGQQEAVEPSTGRSWKNFLRRKGLVSCLSVPLSQGKELLLGESG